MGEEGSKGRKAKLKMARNIPGLFILSGFFSSFHLRKRRGLLPATIPGQLVIN